LDLGFESKVLSVSACWKRICSSPAEPERHKKQKQKHNDLPLSEITNEQSSLLGLLEKIAFA
jgi:hypothetical protein